ncbi:hypothetical protein HaLaN_01501 [Haematococcus lacustris]|uniref:Uncharacterized protein n=1 Tax=Haematococcus lacustris TaxID=44745 RepID=A0A699Y9Q6_HAELA|nr:hypothetical protein HaLaN_01501 [Haematococcus lacustris]
MQKLSGAAAGSGGVSTEVAGIALTAASAQVASCSSSDLMSAYLLMPQGRGQAAKMLYVHNHALEAVGAYAMYCGLVRRSQLPEPPPPPVIGSPYLRSHSVKNICKQCFEQRRLTATRWQGASSQFGRATMQQWKPTQHNAHTPSLPLLLGDALSGIRTVSTIA